EGRVVRGHHHELLAQGLVAAQRRSRELWGSSWGGAHREQNIVGRPRLTTELVSASRPAGAGLRGRLARRRARERLRLAAMLPSFDAAFQRRAHLAQRWLVARALLNGLSLASLALGAWMAARWLLTHSA